MKRPIAILLLFAALAFLPTATAFATVTTESTALGADGQLITLLSGTYGEFFPSGNAADPDVHVLAIRKTSPDGQSSVELVPSTLDQDRETSAKLVLDPASEISYVFWQSWSNLIQSRFRASAYNEGAWSEPIDVSGSGFAWRTSPAFAVTRDQFSDLSEDGTEVTRTILHVVWSEEDSDARWSTMYAPLILENGRYVGQHRVLTLNDLLTGEQTGMSTDLQIAPTIRSRNNENSLVTAFLDQRSGQVVTVEVKFAAGELSIIANEIDDTLARHPANENIESLVSAANDTLQSFGDQVRPEILKPLTTEIGNYLRDHSASGDSGIANIREGARPHIIAIGFRVTAPDIRRVHGDARPHIIALGARGQTTDGLAPEVRHDAQSAMVMSFTAPDLERAPQLLLSNSGRHVMLVWTGEDHIRFQESLPDGSWGERKQLELTDQLDMATAMTVLQQRVDQR